MDAHERHRPARRRGRRTVHEDSRWKPIYTDIPDRKNDIGEEESKNDAE